MCAQLYVGIITLSKHANTETVDRQIDIQIIFVENMKPNDYRMEKPAHINILKFKVCNNFEEFLYI